MEKQDFSLVKALKYFRVYIIFSHNCFCSKCSSNLTQTDPYGKRGKWIAVILEYDIEIKPTKLIKGQGLAKLMVESNFHALDINFVASLDGKEEQVTPQES